MHWKQPDIVMTIRKANRDILYWIQMEHMKSLDICSLNHGEISKTGWKIRLPKEQIFQKESIERYIHSSMTIP